MTFGFGTTASDGADFIARPLEPLPGLKRRPTRAEIDLGAMRNNLNLIRRLAPHSKIMASVKAQAYGHGLLRVAEFLAQEGIDAFAVGFIEEGVWLRKAGITQPILALGGVSTDQIDHYLEYDIALACASRSIATQINEAALRVGRKAHVHLKIDTGMRRLGVYYENALEFAKFVSELPEVKIDGIFSHFATADFPNDEFANLQLKRFDHVLTQLKDEGIDIPQVHFANSGGIVNYPGSHYNMVRPGLLLYGFRPTPEPDVRLDALQPVMTLKSEAVFVKGVRAGEGVSYGLTFRASENCWIATAPVGYGDGYNRALSNRASVLIGGRRYPIVGRICMDQLMILLGREPIEVGEEIVLFGTQHTDAGPQTLDGWELCKLLDTIPYELTCWVSERVPRVYLEPKPDSIRH